MFFAFSYSLIDFSHLNFYNQNKRSAFRNETNIFGGSPMSNTYRLDQIYNILLKKKTATVEELAAGFQVTPTTIRRDLLELEGRKLIYRTRGAAFLLEGRMADANIFVDEKRRIAAAAAAFVTNGMSIALDSGTSVLALSRHLAESPTLSEVDFITHSPKVALEVSKRFHVSLPGGAMSPQNEFLVGSETEEFYKKINADIAFLGSMGVYNCNGLTVSNPLQMSVKHHSAQCASRRIALLDSGKFSMRGMYMFCDYKDIDIMITVKTPDNEAQLDRIADMGVELILV